MLMPRPVLDRARELLGGQHLELDRWLRRLEELETDLLRERQELAATHLELEGQRAHLGRREQQLEDARSQLPVELAAERDRLRRRAKQQLDDGLAKLDEAIREHEKLGKRRRERLRQEALELETPAPQLTGTVQSKPGDRVRVGSLGADGELIEIRGSRALVTIRGKRMWVESDGLQPAARGTAEPKPARRTAAVEVDVVADHELKLLGLDGESARDEVERFLDRALAAGRPSVRIVHGHGTGTLRNVVRDVCRTHPAVRGFRHPPQHMGGKGATEVELVGGSGD
jgi:DNA mismatch repair protein MutS2